MNIVAITNLQVQLQTPNLIISSFKIISTFTFLSRNIFKNKSERQRTRQINATLSTKYSHDYFVLCLSAWIHVSSNLLPVLSGNELSNEV